MNNRTLIGFLVFAVGTGAALAPAGAQGSKKGFGAKARSKVRFMEEAAKKIEQAKLRRAAEDAIRRAEEAIESGEAEKLKRTAERAVEGAELTPAQLQQAAAAKAMLKSARENVSDEAAAILNSPDKEEPDADSEPEATPAAGGGTVVVAETKAVAGKPRGTIEVTQSTPEKRAPGAEPLGALPGDDFPAPVLDKEPKAVLPPDRTVPARENYTKIEADDGAIIDASEKLMVFEGDVKVDHEAFDLSCDTLEVFLYKDVNFGEEKSDGEDTISVSKPTIKRRSDIMKAIASGYVTIVKISRTGEKQVGKCRQATYEDTTGDLVMRGLPQVQNGGNIVIATDEKTTIVFHANGDMEVRGPHRSEIIKTGAVGPASGERDENAA